MGYELKFQPPKVTITTSGGKAKHKLINYCDRNLAYKMVFANGSKYSVDMDKMVGILEVGKTIEVEITRQPGKGPDEDLTIEYYPVAANTSDPSKSTYGAIAGKTVVKLKSTE
ncbi:MSP domain-containing protein [Trichostrongylus colubriformis]|uniref:MSP domain-containing protein n=1 Tax=Trichostrongylus colubriformis TaxID=6319 RepID=A0AAN8IFU0_TRICO